MPDIGEIQKAVVLIACSYGIKRVYLFVFYAKGTANGKRDIDLLVEKGKPMSLLQLSGMRQMVEEALNLSELKMEIDRILNGKNSFGELASPKPLFLTPIEFICMSTIMIRI